MRSILQLALRIRNFINGSISVSGFHSWINSLCHKREINTMLLLGYFDVHGLVHSNGMMAESSLVSFAVINVIYLSNALK